MERAVREEQQSPAIFS